MNYAVIGAGWAGCAAAWRLSQAGHRVTVYEASRHIGGRARSHAHPRLQQATDNGQHILLGAYSSILQLMREIGQDPDRLFLRQDLAIRSADQTLCLRSQALPAPLHTLMGVLGARGLSLAEKWQLIRLCAQLQRQHWQIRPAGLSVQQWLAKGKQNAKLIRLFWQPLCVAAMNTPIDQACAQLFAHVLRDSLGAPRAHSQTLIPLCGLSELWPQQALRGVDLRLGTRVRQIEPEQTGGYIINHESYDAVLVCTQAPHAATLLDTLPATADAPALLQQLQAMQHIPIATVYLDLASAWNLPHPMYLLQDHGHGLQAGQWLFDHSCLHPQGGHNRLAIVISDAGRLQTASKTDLIQAIIEQVREQTQAWAPPMPEVLASDLIMEKRASFAATPELQRPSNLSPWPQLFLAGDWTDTGYPGVLEGAVRSGLQAADLALSR